MAGVEVRRVEESNTGSREMRLCRAWRPSRAVAHDFDVDGDLRIAGQRVAWEGSVLRYDPIARPGTSGAAERKERVGDWLGARDLWDAVGEEADGPWCGWYRLRAALCHERVAPRSPAVRDRLLRALGACPALPEAGMALAGWCLHRGELGSALAWAAMADAVPAPLPHVPHPEGAVAWYVPARMARWLAALDARRAGTAARTALSRLPPPQVAEELLQIVGRSGPTATGPRNGSAPVGSPDPP